MKILKKISKVIVIVMAVLATIWCGLYVYANYFYNDKQIDVENFYIAELPLTPSQFEEDFKEIHQIVMENYSLYQAKHLNMDSLYQAYPLIMSDPEITITGLQELIYPSILTTDRLEDLSLSHIKRTKSPFTSRT